MQLGIMQNQEAQMGPENSGVRMGKRCVLSNPRPMTSLLSSSPYPLSGQQYLQRI